MKPRKIALIAMIALTLLAAPAGATMTYYGSQASWAAATSGVFTTITFDDPSVTTYADYTTTGLHLYEPVVFTATDLLRVYDADYAASGHSVPASWSGDYLLGSGWGKHIQASLPAGVYAVAAQVFTVSFGNNMSFAFSTGDAYGPVATAVGASTFAGFVSDSPIEWVRFSAAGSYTAVDNFAYSQMEETPEASTLLLAGAGLIGLLLARRLRRLC